MHGGFSRARTENGRFATRQGGFQLVPFSRLDLRLHGFRDVRWRNINALTVHEAGVHRLVETIAIRPFANSKMSQSESLLTIRQACNVDSFCSHLYPARAGTLLDSKQPQALAFVNPSQLVHISTPEIGALAKQAPITLACSATSIVSP